MAVTIIPRHEWGALAPKEPLPELQYKPNYISFWFNTHSPDCSEKEECIRVVQGIQKHDMEVDGQPDIEYNFLVGNDGNVYEGRGWKSKAPFLKKDPPPEFPDQTLDIAFIGDYSERKWPYEMLETAISLVTFGVQKKFVQASYFFA